MDLNLKNPFYLGLLGAGQLARLMALESHNWGVQPLVYCKHADEPAAQVTSSVYLGEPTDLMALQNFVSQCDRVSFESEFFPTETLLRLPPKDQKKFFPSIEILQKIQRRRTQKNLLDDFKIPTAPWLPHLTPLKKDFLVLKKNFGGYDGYGTHVFKKTQEIEAFLSTQNPDEWILEKKIPFKRELAFSIARNQQGHFCVFPLVETIQNNNQCDFVVGPTQHAKWPQILKQFKSLMNQLSYEGLLTVELFDTGKELLVNELAPRVHNSAHHSIHSCSYSQFAAHIFCGLNKKLPQIEILSKKFVMANIVGSNQPQPVKIPLDLNAHLCLYGKKINRPRRKMGHFTLLGKDSKLLLAQAKKLQKRIQK